MGSETGLRVDPLAAGSMEIEDVVRSVMELAEAISGAVALMDAKTNSLSWVVSSGLSLPLDQEITRWVAAHGEPVALETCEQALQIPGLVLDGGGALPVICVPVRNNGKGVGALQASFPSSSGGKDFSQRLKILQLAADFVGSIIGDVELRHELQEKEEHVRNMVKATIDAQEAERQRVCMEVHDGVTQTLASAFQYLQAFENTPLSQMPQAKHLVTRAVALVRQAIQEAREVTNSLTPATLNDLGLVATLRQELKQLEAETRCKVEFKADWFRLPKDTETALYRIVHEAITNIRKHARSERIRIELRRTRDHLQVLVKDWGVGFDSRLWEQAAIRQGAGLFSMRKRAELLAGTCEVYSKPGQGTEVRVEVPIIE
jgi:signal transduction histidine kinase